MRNGFLAALTMCACAWQAQAQLPEPARPRLLPPVTSPIPDERIVQPGTAKGHEDAVNQPLVSQPSVSQPSQPSVSEPSVSQSPVSEPPALDTPWMCEPECPCSRFWLNADYLLWWMRNGPVNTPLFTFGDVADLTPGAIGQPGTRVAFGDRPLDYGTFSGLRVHAGYEIRPGLALEGGYFLLERRAVGFGFASDANGNPMAGRPFFNTFNPLGEDNLNTSVNDPGVPIQFAGNSTIVSHSRLQGYELNLAAEIGAPACDRHLHFLVGFRALDLNEDLLFFDTILPPGTGQITFNGMAANPASTITDFDKFRAVNQFFGGQIGARADWDFDRLTVNLVAKVAFGVNQELVTIDGGSTMTTPGVGTVNAVGGVLAQSSNIGRYYRSEFAIVPEGQLNLGWKITPNLTADLGYTIIYWSRVVRPGEQIDRNLNASIIPTHQRFGQGANQGPPFFHFVSNDFWAQGVNFGLTLRF